MTRSLISPLKGFTLLELIITMAIAGVLVGIASPSFSAMLQNSRLTSKNNELLTALTLGKSEALKRGLSVSLCKRNNAGTACDSTKTWSDGWLLFSDQNRDGAIDDEDIIIRVYDALSDNITLAYDFDLVSFNNLGFSEGFNGTFKFCDDRGAMFSHGLTIANTGQLSQAIDTNSDGIPEDSAGTNFTCS